MMFPTLKKIFSVFALGSIGLVALLLVAVQLRKDRTFEAPYPQLHASQDPQIIERGRYLVYGPGHCVDCHGDHQVQGDARRTAPLSGGMSWELPPGKFTAKNITPDEKTGIGRYTDPQIARLLRYGVKPDGRAAIPFMSFGNMVDDDLVAILSFLRSQAAVERAIPDAKPNLLGDAVMAFVIEPEGPKTPPAKTKPPEPTAEYGRYLASDVAGCIACHTQVDMRTGQSIAPPFSGGAEIPSHTDTSLVFITPNLTPHERDGWIAGWNENMFVGRMGAGPVLEHSPMPWRSYQNLSENDRRALYRFLVSLPPSAGGPDPKLRNVQKTVAN